MVTRGQGATTIASWSATIVRALDAEGVDGRAVAAEAGIPCAMLDDPDARVPRDALSRLWLLAVEKTGDPAFALAAARHTMQTTFHALGYAVLASTTLREAVERIIRYRRVLGDIMQLRLEDHGERSRFIIDVSAPRVVPFEAVDAFVCVLVRQARQPHGAYDLRPLSISLERPEPQDSSAWERALRAPVMFAQASSFVEYATADLDRRVPSANAELARQNDEVVVRYLARLDHGALLARTRAAVLESLPSGAPTRQQVAKRLAMSPRTLQRLLAGESTSFSDVVAEIRLALAKSYLEEGRLPVTEIAFVLGFADTSAFSRAFRRWTGKPPSEFAGTRRPARSEGRD
ncbi:MAG TPA: AraC family transcriptional regulator [Candidatus Binatia bacterium]|jgi:AraC-like DNA-binding protein